MAAEKRRGVWRWVLGVAATSALLGAPAERAAADAAGFPAFLEGLRAEALASGLPASVVDPAFAQTVYTPKVIEFDQRQPEFVTPIWTYLDRLVSERRIVDGRAAFAAQRETLAALEARYGVPASVIAAIWGVESNFGSNRGSFDVLSALGTLAFEGRRRAFWKEQVLAALRIVARGESGGARLVGSWAGAMGHTQFIPTSFEAHAVDFTGDGRRDIWADDPTDALASTANYLAEAGWRRGEPWGFHVALPQGFDFGSAAALRQGTAAWGASGVRLADGRPVPAGFEDARLIVPAGASGPAFLTLGNFRSILRYNNATSYALAVGFLSERIAGAGPRPLVWPVDEKPLSRSQARDLQATLTTLGFDTGGVDGILGANSRAAIRRFQAATGAVADGFPSTRLLADVERASELRASPAPRDPLTRDQIREAQRLLSGLGFDPGPADGLVGPRTRSALGAFARVRGARLGARVDAAALSALRRAASGG